MFDSHMCLVQLFDDFAHFVLESSLENTVEVHLIEVSMSRHWLSIRADQLNKLARQAMCWLLAAVSGPQRKNAVTVCAHKI